jgi:addiction module HigA family antidote
MKKEFVNIFVYQIKIVTFDFKIITMLPELARIKGIHPGAILKRELIKRGMKPIQLAETLHEHKQTISAILNERRGINTKLSIQLGQFFEIELDYFLQIQASYDVMHEMQKQNVQQEKPDFNRIRRVLFWDTELDKVDWKQHKIAVIKRVFERGNTDDIDEIVRFYGAETIQKVLKIIPGSFLASFEMNRTLFLNANKSLHDDAL